MATANTFFIFVICCTGANLISEYEEKNCDKTDFIDHIDSIMVVVERCGGGFVVFRDGCGDCNVVWWW